MKKLSQEELKRLLAEKRGTTFVGLITETVPQMRKTNNPWHGRVTKRSEVNGAIGWIYGNSVNYQREREGLESDFTAFPRTWGTRVAGTPLVEHKGKTYLELKVESTREPIYYLDDGSEIDVEKLRVFFPKQKKSARQEVEKEIILRDYSLVNIKEIAIDKNRFEVK